MSYTKLKLRMVYILKLRMVYIMLKTCHYLYLNSGFCLGIKFPVFIAHNTHKYFNKQIPLYFLSQINTHSVQQQDRNDKKKKKERKKEREHFSFNYHDYE